jgi:hypothetical protein
MSAICRLIGKAWYRPFITGIETEGAAPRPVLCELNVGALLGTARRLN